MQMKTKLLTQQQESFIMLVLTHSIESVLWPFNEERKVAPLKTRIQHHCAMLKLVHRKRLLTASKTRWGRAKSPPKEKHKVGKGKRKRKTW